MSWAERQQRSTATQPQRVRCRNRLAVANRTVRVILTEPDQTAISGFWVYGGERPHIGQVISVDSALGAGHHRAQVWRIASGEPYLIFATAAS